MNKLTNTEREWVEYTMEIAQTCLIDNMSDLDEREYLLEDAKPVASMWGGLIENWSGYPEEELMDLWENQDWIDGVMKICGRVGVSYDKEFSLAATEYAESLETISKSELIALSDIEIKAEEDK